MYTTPSQRELFSLFLPLALSGLFYPLASPVINAALARSTTPELALAAFAIARSLSNPLISPLHGLRQVITALVYDQEMLGHMRYWSLILGGAGTAIILVSSWPPIYNLLAGDLMGIPADIVAIGPPVLAVMAFSSALAVSRGYYQGILVRYNRAGPVGTGALGYLLGTAGFVGAGLLWWDIEGALLGALALFVGQIVYLAFVWWPTRTIAIPTHSDDVEPGQRSARYVFYFFLPLALSSLILAGTEPFLQAAIARAPLAIPSLAAGPVCTSLTWLAGVPLWNIQQLVIARVTDRASYQAVRRFVFTVSVVLTGAMGLVALPGIDEGVFGLLLGLEGEVKRLAIEGYRIYFISPFFMGWRSLYHGTLIGKNHTVPIRSATLARVLVLFVMLGGLVVYGQLNGMMVAIWSMLASTVAEVAYLGWHVRKIDW